MATKNLFIAFEGIDGAGCETQAQLLANHLRRRGERVLKLKYPDYSDPYGKLAKLHLHGKLKLTQDRLFLIYLINQIKDRKRIGENLRDGRFVVSNRYFASNLACNCSAHLPVDKAVKVASALRLPKPDLIFYINTNPEAAMKRKLREKRAPVIKSNLQELQKASVAYGKLARKNIWSQWFVIDGNKPAADVKASVLKILQHYIK